MSAQIKQITYTQEQMDIALLKQEQSGIVSEMRSIKMDLKELSGKIDSLDYKLSKKINSVNDRVTKILLISAWTIITSLVGTVATIGTSLFKAQGII